jgi:mono/diheme cytochrome c family protein
MGEPNAATGRSNHADRNTSRVVAAGVALGVAVLTGALSWPASGLTLAADSSDDEILATGARIYRDHCASCHGAGLEGQPDWQRQLPDGGFPAPPHDADGHTWHHSDQLLFEITKFGGQALAPPGFKSNMPAFGDQLSDRDIRAVLAFIKSRWPEEIRRRQLEISRTNQ